jgi:hypothetical protein
MNRTLPVYAEAPESIRKKTDFRAYKRMPDIKDAGNLFKE